MVCKRCCGCSLFSGGFKNADRSGSFRQTDASHAMGRMQGRKVKRTSGDFRSIADFTISWLLYLAIRLPLWLYDVSTVAIAADYCCYGCYQLVHEELAYQWVVCCSTKSMREFTYSNAWFFFELMVRVHFQQTCV